MAAGQLHLRTALLKPLTLEICMNRKYIIIFPFAWLLLLLCEHKTCHKEVCANFEKRWIEQTTRIKQMDLHNQTSDDALLYRIQVDDYIGAFTCKLLDKRESRVQTQICQRSSEPKTGYVTRYKFRRIFLLCGFYTEFLDLRPKLILLTTHLFFIFCYVLEPFGRFFPYWGFQIVIWAFKL